MNEPGFYRVFYCIGVMTLLKTTFGEPHRSMTPAIVRQNVIINRRRSWAVLPPVAACF
ncbi:MAG TPA: hypothetical protein V6C50_10605 [Crinalium sp.]